MDYGFGIQGILGMDFLLRAGAIINLRDLNLEFSKQSTDLQEPRVLEQES